MSKRLENYLQVLRETELLIPTQRALFFRQLSQLRFSIIGHLIEQPGGLDDFLSLTEALHSGERSVRETLLITEEDLSVQGTWLEGSELNAVLLKKLEQIADHIRVLDRSRQHQGNQLNADPEESEAKREQPGEIFKPWIISLCLEMQLKWSVIEQFIHQHSKRHERHLKIERTIQTLQELAEMPFERLLNPQIPETPHLSSLRWQRLHRLAKKQKARLEGAGLALEYSSTVDYQTITTLLAECSHYESLKEQLIHDLLGRVVRIAEAYQCDEQILISLIQEGRLALRCAIEALDSDEPSSSYHLTLSAIQAVIQRTASQSTHFSSEVQLPQRKSEVQTIPTMIRRLMRKRNRGRVIPSRVFLRKLDISQKVQEEQKTENPVSDPPRPQ